MDLNLNAKPIRIAIEESLHARLHNAVKNFLVHA